MRDIKIITHISLDGVIQNSVDGDDFPYPAWNMPYLTPEGLASVLASYGERCDLLFGRRTYDILGSWWPIAPSSPMADLLNAATKYVVTHRPESLEWGPFEAVGPDLVEGVRRIKEQDGPPLVVTGSTSLTSILLENGLVDELALAVNPVLLGTGKRLLGEGTPAQSFELVGSQTTPSGIVFTNYRNAAAIKPA